LIIANANVKKYLQRSMVRNEYPDSGVFGNTCDATVTNFWTSWEGRTGPRKNQGIVRPNHHDEDCPVSSGSAFVSSRLGEFKRRKQPRTQV